MLGKDTTQKTKILVIHPILVPYRIDFLNSLAQKGRLKLLLLKSNSEAKYFENENLEQKVLGDFEFVNRYRRLRRIKTFIDIFKQAFYSKAQIVISSEFSLASVAVMFANLCKGRRFKHVIWTDDNIEFVKDDPAYRKLARLVLSFFVKGWILISKESVDYYLNRYGSKKSALLCPIIHSEDTYTKLLKESLAYKEELRKKFDLNDKKIILFVGRLVELKRVDLAIEAFKLLAKEQPDAVLVIVGDGPEEKKLERLTKSLGIQERVLFVGKYEGLELATWYNLASVFVLPSDIELFGVVVNEALLAGCPAVVSFYVGARSLIEDGVNGEVVSEQNPEMYSKAISRQLDRQYAPLDDVEMSLKPSLMNTTFEDVTIETTHFIDSLTQ